VLRSPVVTYVHGDCNNKAQRDRRSLTISSITTRTVAAVQTQQHSTRPIAVPGHTLQHILHSLNSTWQGPTGSKEYGHVHGYLRSNSLSAVGTLQSSEQSAAIMCVALMPVSAPLPTSVVMLAIMASAQNPQLQNVKHQQQCVGTSPQDVLVAAHAVCKQLPPSLQHQ